MVISEAYKIVSLYIPDQVKYDRYQLYRRPGEAISFLFLRCWLFGSWRDDRPASACGGRPAGVSGAAVTAHQM